MSVEETKGTRELLSKIDRNIEDIRNKQTADSLRIKLLEDIFEIAWEVDLSLVLSLDSKRRHLPVIPTSFNNPNRQLGPSVLSAYQALPLKTYRENSKL